MPAAEREELYARLTPSGDVRGDDAAREDRTEERRKMMEAFSNAREVCEVNLEVNASCLNEGDGLIG
jgi:hypothetical protein